MRNDRHLRAAGKIRIILGAVRHADCYGLLGRFTAKEQRMRILGVIFASCVVAMPGVARRSTKRRS